MPTLNQLNCSIELGGTNVALKEYGISYSDGEVECFVAVPSLSDIDFSIHLTSERYIAPGIALYVFIDGEYQCNRSRRGLLVPRHDTPENLYQVDLRARQKEEKQPGGGFIAYGWTFLSLSQIPQEETTKINTKFLENLGDIEVVVLRCKEAPSVIPMPLTSRAEPDFEKRDRHGSRLSSKRSGPPNSPPASESFGGMMGIFDGPFDDPKDDPFQPSGNRTSAWKPVPEQQGGIEHNPSLAPHSTEPLHYDPFSIPPMRAGLASPPALPRGSHPAPGYAHPPRFGPVGQDQPEEQLQSSYAYQGRAGGSGQPPAFGTHYPYEPRQRGVPENGYPYEHRQRGYPLYGYTLPHPGVNTSSTTPDWYAGPASTPLQARSHGAEQRHVPESPLGYAAFAGDLHNREGRTEHKAVDPDDSSDMYKPVDPEVWKAWKKANIRTPNKEDDGSKMSTRHKSTPQKSTPRKSTSNNSFTWDKPVDTRGTDSWDKTAGNKAGGADAWVDVNQQSTTAARGWGNDADVTSPKDADVGWEIIDSNKDGDANPDWGDEIKSAAKKTASNGPNKTASVAGWGNDVKTNNASMSWDNGKKPDKQQNDGNGWEDSLKDTAAKNGWGKENQASGGDGVGVWDQAARSPLADKGSEPRSKRNSPPRSQPMDIKHPERSFRYQREKRHPSGADTPRPTFKPYWADWDKKPEPRTTAAEGARTADLHSPFVGPAPPPVHVPKETAEKLDVQYQVGLGKAAHYDHICARPEYLDDFKNPYAVFRFKYRSKKFVEDVFDVKVKDDEDHLKAKLSDMSKDQLVKALFEMKLEEKASTCNDSSTVTRVKSWANEHPISVVKSAHQSSHHSNNTQQQGNNAWENNDAAPAAANAGGWEATPVAPAEVKNDWDAAPPQGGGANAGWGGNDGADAVATANVPGGGGW